MEYFVMLPDEELGSYKKIDFSIPQFQGKEPFVVHTDLGKEEEFPDFFFGKSLFAYSFCVSDRMKEVMEAYTSHLQAVPFFLTDHHYRDQRVYWTIRPKQIDCFQTTWFPDVRNLKWGEVPWDMPYIFLTAQAKAQYLVVSLELAENLLRRQMFGIQFIRIGKEETSEPMEGHQ